MPEEKPANPDDGLGDDAGGQAVRQVSQLAKTVSGIASGITGGIAAVQGMMAFLDGLNGKQKPDLLALISQQLTMIVDLIERTTKGAVLADVRENQRVLEQVRSDCETAVHLCRRSPNLARPAHNKIVFYEPPTESQLATADELSFRAVALLSNLDSVVWTRMRHPMFLNRPTVFAGDIDHRAAYDGATLVWDHRWVLGTLLHALVSRQLVLVALGSERVSTADMRSEHAEMAATIKGIRDRILGHFGFNEPMQTYTAVKGGATVRAFAWHEGTGTVKGADWSAYYSTFNYPTSFNWVQSTPTVERPFVFPDARKWGNWLNDSREFREIHYAFMRVCAQSLATDLGLFDLDSMWYRLDRSANPNSTATLDSGILSRASMPPDWGV